MIIYFKLNYSKNSVNDNIFWVKNIFKILLMIKYVEQKILKKIVNDNDFE